MRKIIENNRIKSIMINMVIMFAILVCVSTTYETNDDHTISKMIANDYPNLGFVNYFLCRLLIILQNYLGRVNVFILSQIFMSYCAFVVLLKIIFDRSDSKFLDAISVAAIAVFSLDHYAVIQFTKTSAFLLTVGFIAITDAMLNKNKWYYYIEGILLVELGAAYRWNTLLPTICFLCVFIGVGLLITVKDSLEKRIKVSNMLPSSKQIISGIIAIAIAIGLAYTINSASNSINRSTEQLCTARTYSSLRARLTDFPTDSLYEDYKQECDTIGVDANDIELIHNWVFDYDGAASLENLKVLSKLGRDMGNEHTTIESSINKFIRGLIRSFKKMDYTAIHVLLLAIIALFMLVSLRPKYWLYVIGFGVLTICIYIYLYYIQRPVYRTLYIADVSAFAWLLYTAAQYKLKPNLIGIVVAIIMLGTCVYAIPRETTRIEARHNSFVNKIRSNELEDYFSNNRDCVFICEVNGWNNARTYQNPLIIDNSEDNSFSVGGWSTQSPYQLERLGKYGIENPIRDLIDNDRAFYVGNARLSNMIEYYNKWYGTENNRIDFILIDEISNKKIWKIVSNSHFE